jgi:hypothetical protein
MILWNRLGDNNISFVWKKYSSETWITQVVRLVDFLLSKTITQLQGDICICRSVTCSYSVVITKFQLN